MSSLVFGFVSPSPVVKMAQPTIAQADGTVRVPGGWSVPADMVGNPVQFLQAKQMSHGGKTSSVNLEKARLMGFALDPKLVAPPYESPAAKETETLVAVPLTDSTSDSSDESDDSEEELVVDYPLALVPVTPDVPDVEEDEQDDESNEESDEENLDIISDNALSRSEFRPSKSVTMLERYKNVVHGTPHKFLVKKLMGEGIVIDARVSEVGRRRCLSRIPAVSGTKRIVIRRLVPAVQDALVRQRDWKQRNFPSANINDDEFSSLLLPDFMGSWQQRFHEIADTELRNLVWSGSVFDEGVSRKLLALIYYHMDSPLFPNADVRSATFEGPRELDQICALLKYGKVKVLDAHIRRGLSGQCNPSAVYAPDEDEHRTLPRDSVIGTVRGVFVTQMQAAFIVGMTDSAGSPLFPGYMGRLIPYVQIPDREHSATGVIGTFIDPDQVVLHNIMHLDLERTSPLLPSALSSIHDDHKIEGGRGCYIPYENDIGAGNVHYRLFSHDGSIVLAAVTNRPIQPDEELTVSRSNPLIPVAHLGGIDASSLDRQITWDDELREFVARPTPERVSPSRAK